MAREMMTVPIPETFPEFEKRHGGHSMREGKRCYFPDGATTVEDGFSTHFLEPPEDNTKRLECQKVYVELRITNLEGAFYEVQEDFHQKAVLAANSRNVPGPPENYREILEGIKGQYEYWKEQLDIIVAKLAETPAYKRELALQADNRADADNRRRQAQEIRSLHL